MFISDISNLPIFRYSDIADISVLPTDCPSGLDRTAFFFTESQVKKHQFAFSAYIEMKMGMRCSLVKENKSIEQRLNLSRS